MRLQGSLLVAVLFAASSISVGADAPARTEADRLFASGDFKAAATAYRSLLEECSLASVQPAAKEPVSPGPGVIEPVVSLPANIPPVGKGGTPVLLALISEQGCVLDVRIIKPAGEAVGPAAVNALRTAQITPATRAGQPVRMWVTKSVTIPAAE